MKKIILTNCIIIICFLLFSKSIVAQQNKYIQRFIDQRAKIVDKNNGYFSPEGAPYHSIETLMCEAPDQGHESTSEAYSFWVWLEAMNGRVAGDWTPLNNAWLTLAKQTIPADSLQPTNNAYVNGGAKATFAAEYPLPSMYPSALDASVPVGTEPVSKELSTTYGTTSVYGMHWLFDCDNFYGFGIKRATNAKPSYINTFQRGEQESTWETVPQPCYDLFKAGGTSGYLDLFVKESGTPSKQWKYTNAPDADARAVQAMYWATEWAKAQGKPASTVPGALASKMGDYLRLAMFDKYYKPIGCQSKSAAGASGYGSCHYLISWYYAWGGPDDATQNWAWRIGCSHSHFGYQNPLAAYALSNDADLIPKSPNAKADWTASLQRQLEFYRWLQSSEGAIAGGCTNMLNGNYSVYPTGTSTFYNMAYQENPVYHDPGSNTWFGMQAWSVERLAEYYYLTNNALAKQVLDKWVLWVRSVVKINADGTFSIPSEISWSGQPDTWNAASPGANAGLHVTVVSSGTDLGITACTAKALTYYAAATRKYGILDDNARKLAQDLLDGLYNNYWEGVNGKGYGVPEERKDYRRFDSLVYIPAGWSGKMPNGDVIKPGVTFLDIRSQYKNDPQYAAMRTALSSGQVFKTTFHRFWAQADIALANAEYGYFFGDTTVVAVTSVTVAPTSLSVGIGATSALAATVLPANATNKTVTWTTSNAAVATVSASGIVTGVAKGTATITVTTVDGAKTATVAVTVTGPISVVSVSVTPSTDSLLVGATTQLLASILPANATNKSVTWTTSNAAVATVSSTGLVTGVAAGSATITVTTVDGSKTATCAVIVNGNPTPCSNPTAVSMPIKQDGIGEFCWTTTGTINYVSSWNMDLVEVNGVAFTNKYSNTMPATIDGKYYIHYKASVAWAHLEVIGTGSSIVLVTGVSVSPTTASVSAGLTTTLTATVAPSNATNKSVTWSSSNTTVATVSASGVVTGVANGSAIITVTTVDQAKTASATVTVSIGSIAVTGVTVSPTTASIAPVGTAQLVATVLPTNATNKTVSWTSSNTAIATVSATGLVTGIANGSATITVTTQDGNMTATCAVTVTTGGTSCAFGAPLANALPSISKSYNYVYVIGSGPSLANVSKFTINWDLPNKGLYQLSVDTKDGKPNWYVDMRSSATQTFGSVQPGITFLGSGFPGLDGTYYVAIDNGNFVLAEKSGAYTIYFSTSATAPVCTKSAKVQLSEMATGQKQIILYPNPFTNKTTLQISNAEEVKSLIVVNQLGSVVKVLDVNQFKNSQIEFGNELPAGIYFIQVCDKESIKTFKVIKK